MQDDKGTVNIKDCQGVADETFLDVRPAGRFSRRVRRTAIWGAAASFLLWGVSVVCYFDYTHDRWSLVLGGGTIGVCLYDWQVPSPRTVNSGHPLGRLDYGLEWPEYVRLTYGVSIVSLPFWLPSLLFASIAAWMVMREQRRTVEPGRCRCCCAAGVETKQGVCTRCRRMLRYGRVSLVLISAAALYASLPILNIVPAIVGVWIFGLTILFVFPQAVRFARGGKSRSSRYCPKCDYNLTGNTSGICPECGTRIFSKRDHGVTHTA